MDKFDAKAFLEKITRGDFDGRIHEEFEKLSAKQVEQVALLAMERTELREPGMVQRGSVSISSAPASDTAERELPPLPTVPRRNSEGAAGIIDVPNGASLDSSRRSSKR